MAETKQRGKGAAETRQGPPDAQVYPFQTEMQQLLQILIHSLYSEREIFLRELISNASDAINRLKFHLHTHPDVRDKEAELEIELQVDAEGKALTVSDTGIGMTREEMMRNLGTIARSGTLEFVKQLSAAEPGGRADLIGQFGVGFYSVFMVARRVVVESCPADPEQEPTRWVSEGQGQFSVEPGSRKRRGTTVRVELKEESEEFCAGTRVEDIVRRYSNFIAHPIRLDGRRLNVQEAIWAQPKGAVSEEQYREFYKFLTHGVEEPLHTIHLAIDAPVQYQALLYLPRRLTNSVLYSPTGFGLELYASKVLIQSECQELLPLYLRFLRGVVDTEDLPLNVSRETVQHNRLVARLRTSLTGRVLRELKSLAEGDPETYKAFWLQYGKVLKEGIPGDTANRERLLELARFDSSHCTGPDELTTLSEYVSRMKAEQKEILYFSGPSREAIERNPHLEFFQRQGLEVLYLYDQVDDFVMTSLGEFEGKRMASIDQAELEALKTEEAKAEPAEALSGEALSGKALDGLLALLKTTLGEQVSDVRASKRLVDSPALLVSADGLPGSLAKVMKMLDKDFQSTPKVLEVNAAHPLIRSMARLREHDARHPALTELAEQLMDNCLLVEGLLQNPERMVSRIQSLMTWAAALQAEPAPAEPQGQGDAPAVDPDTAAGTEPT